MYFHYFIIISPWKGAGPFILTNLNPLHPGILCAKFGWNWPSGSGEVDENVKSLQTDGRTDGRTDRQTTDDRRSEKLSWAFSSGELIKELILNVLAPTLIMFNKSEYITNNVGSVYNNALFIKKWYQITKSWQTSTQKAYIQGTSWSYFFLFFKFEKEK